MVNHYVGITREVVRKFIAGRSTILGALNNDITKYIPDSLNQRRHALLKT